MYDGTKRRVTPSFTGDEEWKNNLKEGDEVWYIHDRRKFGVVTHMFVRKAKVVDVAKPTKDEHIYGTYCQNCRTKIDEIGRAHIPMIWFEESGRSSQILVSVSSYRYKRKADGIFQTEKEAKKELRRQIKNRISNTKYELRREKRKAEVAIGKVERKLSKLEAKLNELR